MLEAAQIEKLLAEFGISAEMIRSRGLEPQVEAEILEVAEVGAHEPWHWCHHVAERRPEAGRPC